MVFRWLRNERSGKRFSHTRLGVWVQVCGGISGHVACVRFQFLFCHPPLPDMPHPPIHEVLVECVKLRCNYSLATFCVIVRQYYVLMLIKVRLCGSAWHGSQQCVRNSVFMRLRENRHWPDAPVVWRDLKTPWAKWSKTENRGENKVYRKPSSTSVLCTPSLFVCLQEKKAVLFSDGIQFISAATRLGKTLKLKRLQAFWSSVFWNTCNLPWFSFSCRCH